MLTGQRKSLQLRRSRDFFNRLPIRFKITLPYLFLVLAFSLGVAMLSSRIILETVDERFTNQLYEAGKIATEAVVSEETRLLATMRLLSNMQGVAEAVSGNNPEMLRELSLGTIINHQEETVAFLDAQGQLVLELQHRKGGLVEEYEASTGGTTYAAWKIVQQVQAHSADALGDKFTGYVITDRGDYLYIAGPVKDPQGQFSGTLLIGKSLDSLARQIREETLAQVTFYNFNGEPVASTFPNPSFLDSATVTQILNRQGEESYRRNSDRRDFESLNMNYGEILAPWEVRGDVDLGVLGVSLIKNTLITANLPTRIQITVLITLTVFIILIVGINLARLITRPLMRLVEASRRVAGGDLQVKLPISSRDEIADLTASFNQMIDSVQQSKQDLINSYDKTLHGWSKALEYRDHETQGHSQRVTDLTLALAARLGLPEESLPHVRRGAILHDIGKMGIPDAILRKPGPLTDEEWAVMRQHPKYAYDMLGDIEYLKPALDIPYCHHEKWDGAGYPRGLKGEQIPVAARLFAIVDVWDALTSDRPYRKRMTDQEAMKIIQAGSGSHFDPRLVTLFYQYMLETAAPGSLLAAEWMHSPAPVVGG